ncbi:hypothetical protein [Demequina sp. NBRC 110051]|uniref:hypothetical protein n=1 Tax=Demequina sp. NBRC 110051 TaxID=1570340 RepID=UPI00135634C5|nr:hypothetical protein [Demequina sp. NBRC 110051]
MISTWMWSRIPGPVALKVLLLLVVIVAAVLVLFEFVFPWVSTIVPVSDPTLEEAGS